MASRSFAAWNSFGSSKFCASAPPAKAAIVALTTSGAIILIMTLPPVADFSALHRALAPLARAAPAPGAERHRGDQNEALRRLLQGLRQAHQGEKRKKGGQREGAGDRADQRAPAAHQLHPAHDTGRNRLQLEPTPDTDRDAAESAEQ